MLQLPKRDAKEKDKKKRIPNADQLVVLTQFCRSKEELICRSLHSLEFGELTVHSFRALLSAEPETESLRSSKKGV